MTEKKCTIMCPQFGYCRNKRNSICLGFLPMDSDEEEEENDPDEERIERMSY